MSRKRLLIWCGVFVAALVLASIFIPIYLNHIVQSSYPQPMVPGPRKTNSQSVETRVFVPKLEITAENVTYGIKRGDSLEHVEAQAKQYGLVISTEAVNSEAGEEIGFYLHKSTNVALIVVFFENKVHWIDVLEKGATVNGIVVGSRVTDYLNKDEFKIYECRDCSLDDIIVFINGVKALIGSEHWKAVYQYKTQKDPKFLEGLVIKGVEL